LSKEDLKKKAQHHIFYFWHLLPMRRVRKKPLSTFKLQALEEIHRFAFSLY